MLIDGINLVEGSEYLNIQSGLRQTVHDGPVDSNGYASFLSAGTGLNVDLAATSKAVILSFADGFNVDGALDYSGQITADATSYFGTLAANAENYLYVDRNVTTGALTGGAVTNLPPVYGKTYTDAEGVGKSYLNFDGTDGSTTFTDANSNITWTAAGNAQLDTAQSKFGGSSLLLDGSGDYITSDQALYTAEKAGGFKLDCWVRPNSTSRMTIFRTGVAFCLHLGIQATTGKLELFLSSNGSSWDIVNGAAGTTGTTTGNWHHVRLQWDGSTYKVYLNGTEEISVTSSAALFTNSINLFRIGADSSGGLPFNGWIDDFSYEVGPQTLGAFTAPTTARGGIASDGEHWFDTTEMKMKAWNQSTTSWDEKQRVFVGEATTDATTVTSATTYQLRGEYDSGWFNVQAGQDYNKNHNLGTKPETVNDYIRQSLDQWETGQELINDSTQYWGGPPTATTRMQAYIQYNSTVTDAGINENVNNKKALAGSTATTFQHRLICKRGW